MLKGDKRYFRRSFWVLHSCHSSHGIKITFQSIKLWGFFPLFLPTQWLHTTGRIGPAEQSKIEAETEYQESFRTLSGDPRRIRDSGVYKIKRWGGGQHISHEGEGGRESFTHPRGRSESLTSDLSLKEGNLGEGERNMSKQGKKKESGRNKESSKKSDTQLIYI